MTRLFIYGTLKRGCYNHYHLHGQTFVATASTEPAFNLFNLGGFPGMVRAGSGSSIDGEIWEVDDKCLKELDVLEDVEGGEYALEFIRLLAPHDAEPIRTYIYKRSVVGRPLAGTSWTEN